MTLLAGQIAQAANQAEGHRSAIGLTVVHLAGSNSRPVAYTFELDESLLAAGMRAAIAEAKLGENPYGAVLLNAASEIICRAQNTSKSDPTAHAEVNLIRLGAQQQVNFGVSAVG